MGRPYSVKMQQKKRSALVTDLCLIVTSVYVTYAVCVNIFWPVDELFMF